MDNDTLITIRISKPWREKLDWLAKSEMRSLSAEIRLAIKNHLHRRWKTVKSAQAQPNA